MPLPPDLELILDTAAEAIRRRAVELDEAQEPLGVDALRETELHGLLESGFRAAGLGVHREVCLPGAVEQRARRSARDRCDFVLTADPARRLLDPVEELRAIDRATGTLFEPIAPGIADPAPTAAGFVEPEDATWLEVKHVHRVRYVNGIPGPDPRYASRLVDGPAGDAVKLALDARIEKAAAMVVVFGEDEPGVRSDLAAMGHALLDRGVPIGSPLVSIVSITDRVGNACCAVCVLPVRL